jgi:hypothetical protein
VTTVTQPLRDEHKELIPHVDALRTAADAVGDATPDALREAVDGAYDFLAHHQQVAGAVSIQALRGRVSAEADGARSDMRPGQLLVLDADVGHVATAVTDCAILITMSMD